MRTPAIAPSAPNAFSTTDSTTRQERQMQSIKSGILLASAATLLLLGACSADKDAKPAAATPQGPAAATVNGMPISQSTVDKMVKQGANSGQPDTPEVRKAIIDQLALQMVVAEEAVKKGLDKTPEVTEQVAAIRQVILASAYMQDFVKSNPVTDDRLNAEYERIKATITGSEYKARHILVETEAEAKDIIAKLKADPGAFEKLATERSLDAGSKAQGGELGWFDLSTIAPEFGAAMSKLEKAKFTETPVQTQFGYHVILLEDTKAIEAPPLDEVKPMLSQQIQQQDWDKQLEAFKAKSKVEIVGASAPAP
jgi:peptidyl-prolyl cis-trans isomerase C